MMDEVLVYKVRRIMLDNYSHKNEPKYLLNKFREKYKYLPGEEPTDEEFMKFYKKIIKKNESVYDPEKHQVFELGMPIQEISKDDDL